MTFSVKVENGIVTNRIRGTLPGWIETDVAQIDWEYDGTAFTPPPWDSSFAPSQWHRWEGDKETRIGTWVEDTEAKAKYERRETFNDADANTFKTIRETYTRAQVEAYIDDAFPDPKQNRIVKMLVKDAVRNG